MSSIFVQRKASLLIMSCLSLSGVAHAGLFDNYTDTAQSFRASLTQPLNTSTQELFQKKTKSNDAALYL